MLGNPAPGVLARVSAESFPESTPLNAFFAWNEARLLRDRRYIVARDICRLLTRIKGGAAAVEVCVAHLAAEPVIRWRFRDWMIVSRARAAAAAAAPGEHPDALAAAAARDVVSSLLASIGSADVAAHAALFRAFEALEAYVSVGALARLRPRRKASRSPVSGRRILIIKLSALGDFIQALGPAAALRRHHRGDWITLLTTRPFAEFAKRTGLFDEILIDHRPKAVDIVAWLGLRRSLRARRFDRVYDLQTSDRSSLYAWLLFPGPSIQWSGIAPRCSHPHANLQRDPQHTIDKQAEQLLMAGIHPVPLPALPPVPHLKLPDLEHRPFVLLMPGSSPRHPRKRWLAERYGELARLLRDAGYLSVVTGASGEEELAHAIRAVCPDAVDLVGKTDLMALADLAGRAALTVGNDTGATHVAAAGGHPVVVLFSDASEPSRCAPRGGVVRVISKRDLGDLPVERVFAEVIGIVGEPLGARSSDAEVLRGSGQSSQGG